MKRLVVVSAGVAALVLGIAVAWYGVRQEREFQRLIAAGDAGLAQDQTFVAIEAFSGALALKRDSMLAYLKRGDTYRRRGELSAALRDLRQAAALDPTAPRPIELLGDVNVGMGRYERAAEHYRAFTALDDRAPHVFYKLALAYYRHGQAAMAIEPLRRAVALDERFTEAHYLLGMCFRATGDDDEALRALTRAVNINAAFVAAREELADLHAAAGRTRDAVEQLEALAALEPARAERLVTVGLAYARAGRTDAAVLTLGRAADRFPQEPVVYTALGRIWLETAETRNDRVALGKAIEALQPTAAGPSAPTEALVLYGRALFLSGEIEAAERALQQAVVRRPVDPVAFRYLADAAERLGHPSVASDALRRYVALEDERHVDPAIPARLERLQRRLPRGG
ncbi:MAG: tetratricopeptide repeat protein [Acidobacteria bacterium]|nr:tetratricopeptide repeat protein [Acidobacteriota bacterium]